MKTFFFSYSVPTDDLFPQIIICGHRLQSVLRDYVICSHRLQSVPTDGHRLQSVPTSGPLIANFRYPKFIGQELARFFSAEKIQKVWWLCFMFMFETIESICGAFYLFDPGRANKFTFDLFFNNYETIRLSLVKLYFFSKSLKQEKSIKVFDSIEATIECDPYKKNNFVIPCTGCDPVTIWSIDPWLHSEHNEIIKLLYLFSWINHASSWHINFG